MDIPSSGRGVCVCRSVSQPMLTQPTSLSASLGSYPRLTCTLSVGFCVGSYDIYWFQQQPGSPPQFLQSFYSVSDQHQFSGVPRRFCGSKDASGKAGHLLISRLQAEDKADYFCATAHGGGSSYRSSQGLRSQGISPGTRDLVPETLVLRSFCAGSCRGESPVGRPVLGGEE
uniref:Ig-like domain-containing protein n=1 Tax=Ailuropoda melanoleuca TaxID=9646 RepID=A0A7N5KC76_AILME